MNKELKKSFKVSYWKLLSKKFNTKKEASYFLEKVRDNEKVEIQDLEILYNNNTHKNN